jgi:SAM-dependent methyltransferase
VPSGFKEKVLKENKVIGGGYRLNVVCPNCGSGDRERLIYVFLKDNQLVHKEMKMLHFAPERRLLHSFEKEGMDYYSADLESPLARIKMDVGKINFPDSYFDAIICNHVLEHVLDDQNAIKELCRVLKPDGWAILQVPYSPILAETFEDPSVISRSERRKVFGQFDHVRIYGKDYVNRLQSGGFRVEEKKLDVASTKKFALNDEEPIFFCTMTDT